MLKKLKVEYYYIISYLFLDVAIECNKQASKACKKGLDSYKRGDAKEGTHHYNLMVEYTNKRDKYDKKSQYYFDKFLASRKLLKDV